MDGALKSFTEDLDLVAPAVWHALPEVHALSLLFTSARRLPALQCDGQVRLLTVVQQHLSFWHAWPGLHLHSFDRCLAHLNACNAPSITGATFTASAPPAVINGIVSYQ